VQNRQLANGFMLTRVGVTGVKKPVVVRRAGKSTTLTCVFDLFVDLPSNQKGSHLSRNLELIAEVVDRSIQSPVKGIEELAASMCRDMLQRHEYATVSEVRVQGDYFLERVVPGGRRTVEAYTLMAKATLTKGEEVRKMIGVRVIGMTACPCAMETVQDIKGSAGDCGANITHNQRNVCTVMLEVPERFEVEANDLIEIVEASFSSPTFEILKRSEEAHVVIEAHDNPKFVEDVVRGNLQLILERYTSLPDETMVTVRSESEESIHKHNAFAERITTLGGLRN
jgi:GTP cyclohydrolase-4